MSAADVPTVRPACAMSTQFSGCGAGQQAFGTRGMNDTLTGLGWDALSSETRLPAQARPSVQEGERVGWSFSLAANCRISVLTREGPLWALTLVVTSQICTSLS